MKNPWECYYKKCSCVPCICGHSCEAHLKWDSYGEEDFVLSDNCSDCECLSYRSVESREMKILDENKQIVEATLKEWVAFRESGKFVVDRTRVRDDEVSTVFLCSDHSFGFGPPLWFETMIFGGEHHNWQERYSTYSEAQNGHARAVKALEKRESPMTFEDLMAEINTFGGGD